MKKTMLALLLAVSFILPSAVLAGQGATTWYGAHFNDSDNAPDGPFNFATWISIFNPNDNDAVVKVTYYKNDGTKYANFNNNSTVFTHTVAPKKKANWRPSSDLDLQSTYDFKGSYVINATQGSVVATAALTKMVGEGHPLRGSQYNINDKTTSCPLSLHTTTSTYLTFDAFIHDDDGDDHVLTAGEWVTWFSINNPSDTDSAEVEMTIYDENGTELTTQTLNLSPHQKLGITPGDYNIGLTGMAKGSVVLDAKKGSIIANYSKFWAEQGKASLNYGATGGTFQKHLVVQ